MTQPCALRCVALRCVALRCAALRCVAFMPLNAWPCVPCVNINFPASSSPASWYAHLSCLTIPSSFIHPFLKFSLSFFLPRIYLAPLFSYHRLYYLTTSNCSLIVPHPIKLSLFFLHYLFALLILFMLFMLFILFILFMLFTELQGTIKEWTSRGDRDIRVHQQVLQVYWRLATREKAWTWGVLLE